MQRLQRQKAEREIIDFRAGGSWEIYRNNNNEHGDTLRGEGERGRNFEFVIELALPAAASFSLLSSLNLQFNSISVAGLRNSVGVSWSYRDRTVIVLERKEQDR